MQLVLRPQALQSSSVQTSAVLGARALPAGTAVWLLHGANPEWQLYADMGLPTKLGHSLRAILLFTVFVYAPLDTHSWKCTFLGSSDTQNGMESLPEMVPLTSRKMCFVFLCPQKMGMDFWLPCCKKQIFSWESFCLLWPRLINNTAHPGQGQAKCEFTLWISPLLFECYGQERGEIFLLN